MSALPACSAIGSMPSIMPPRQKPFHSSPHEAGRKCCDFARGFADSQLQYTGFLASTHSSTPAWFARQGKVQPTGKWSMLPGNTYTGPASFGGFFTGTPYQSYDATGAFNANWLLKRDLDPASNDNHPMWLERSA
jgi:hypothetical protein